MHREPTSTEDKALAIHLVPEVYGTLAEIGAGQEVARSLFRVGGAAGTVAKSISAYEMKFTMLDTELSLLDERLAAKRGPA